MPLPWVPFAPEAQESDPGGPNWSPPDGGDDGFGGDDEPSFRPGSHRWRRLVSVVAIVGLGVMIGSGAAALGQHLGRPKEPVISPTPSTVTKAAAQAQLAQVAANDLPELVTVVAVGSQSEELGTGWPVDSNGDFITNDHVVHEGQSFHVVTPSGAEYPASVVNSDPSLDLAEVHAAGLQETPFPISSGAPSMGEPVVVLASQGATGHPPVTDSAVAGLGDRASVSDAEPGELSNYSDLIRLPAQIYPGNSGGPVLSERGQVVGILTLAAQSGRGAFAIPLAEVEPEIQKWLDT